MLEEAIVVFSSAVKIKQDDAVLWSNLGNALHHTGKIEEACKCFEKGSQRKNVSAELYDNWGTTLSSINELAESLSAHKKAVALNPEFAHALANLGNTYRYMGRLDDALMNLDAAHAISPSDQTIASARLYTMNFIPVLTNSEVAQAHQLWPVSTNIPMSPFTNGRDPDRILKVGYVSADFRFHSCANFLLPLLERHDKENVHVTAFSSVSRSDQITEQIRDCVDDWVDVGAASDEGLASNVRARSIDILIDCGGHTTSSKLSAFAHRSAPLQISWLGYPNTSGLKAIDFHISDAVTKPPEMADLFAEELLILNNGFHTFRPLVEKTSASPVPSKISGHITFGVVHNLAKMSDNSLRLWASVLRSVPESRLLIKARSLIDSVVLSEFKSRCILHGLEESRLNILSWKESYGDQITDLDAIDIALDATPYNGTTTTCEAMWMGIPVVTLRGDRPAGRVGASLLTQVGRTEWIADSDEDYIRIARSLAEDAERLSTIRASLRDEMKASTLGDATLFAQSMESAYRKLWQDWCKKTSV